MKKCLLLFLALALLVTSIGSIAVYAAQIEDQPAVTEDINTDLVSHSVSPDGEIESLRTLDSKTFQLSDGTFQYVAYAEDVHYKDKDGKLKNIDNSITDKSNRAGYAFGNKENSWKAYFADKLTDKKAVLLEKDKYKLSFNIAIPQVEADTTEQTGVETPQTEADATEQTGVETPRTEADATEQMEADSAEQVDVEIPQTDADATEQTDKDTKKTNKQIEKAASKVAKASVLKKTDSIFDEALATDDRAVVYQDVLPNVDIAYTVKTGVLKEDIILRDESAPNTYVMDLNFEGLSIIESEGTISFVDGKKQVFELAPMFMEDSNGKYSDKVEYKIDKTEYGARITIIADKAFLNEMDTQYPVVIDPTITIVGTANTYDTYVSSTNPNTNYNSGSQFNYLRTGKDSPYGVRYTYIRFPEPSYPANSTVTSANMKLYRYSSSGTMNLRAYRVTSSWSSSTVTWNNKPGMDTSTDVASAYSAGGNWFQLDVTNWVRKFKTGTANNGFCLRDTNESNTSVWFTFYSSDYSGETYDPVMTINYTTTAPTYTVSYAANGGTGTAPTSQTVNAGSSVVTRANTFARANYTFAGWNTNSSGTGTNIAAGATYTPTGNTTLYAKWTEPTLIHWYSDSDMIGRWTSTPSVFAKKLNNNIFFDLDTYVSHAKSQWQAQSISTSTAQSESTSKIKVFSGDYNDILLYSNKFNSMPYGVAGYCQPEYIFDKFYRYNNQIKTGVFYNAAYCAVIDAGIFISADQYKNVATHELGHGLGWLGHADSPDNVMYKDASAKINLSPLDIIHLKQVY